jgi:hypothetical protein
MIDDYIAVLFLKGDPFDPPRYFDFMRLGADNILKNGQREFHIAVFEVVT